MSIGMIIYRYMKMYSDISESNISNVTTKYNSPHEVYNWQIEKLPKSPWNQGLGSQQGYSLVLA